MPFFTSKNKPLTKVSQYSVSSQRYVAGKCKKELSTVLLAVLAEILGVLDLRKVARAELAGNKANIRVIYGNLGVS